MLVRRTFAVFTLFAAVAVAAAASGADVASAAGEGGAGASTLRVWVAPAPGVLLAGGRVRVENRAGALIGSAVTSSEGTALIRIAEERGAGPFTISVRGGTVRGDAFDGRVTALVGAGGIGRAVVAVDVVSTSARQLAGGRSSARYAAAKRAVRRALGVPVDASDDHLRVGNWHVDENRLLRAAESRGGYAALIDHVVWSARRGVHVRHALRPDRRARWSAKAPAARQAGAALGQVCSATMSGTANGSAPSGAGFSLGAFGPMGPQISTTQVQNLGIVGVSALLKNVLGTTGGSIVMGMLFPSQNESPEQLQALGSTLSSNQQLLSDQLSCVSQQINQLSTQVQQLQLQVAQATVSTCAANIQTAWVQYAWLLTHNTTAQALQVHTNPSVAQDVQTWLAQLPACAQQIDTMLFGSTAANISGAWNQLYQQYASVANTQPTGMGGPSTDYALTPLQVQRLRTYLAYWGALEYQATTLLSEAYGALGQTQNQQILASGVVGGVCVSPQPGTVCGFSNNLAMAMPDSLYTDELGYLRAGAQSIAVRAIPGGLAKPGKSATWLTADGIQNQCATRSLSPWAVNLPELNYVAFASCAETTGHPITLDNGAVVTNPYCLLAFGDQPSSLLFPPATDPYSDVCTGPLSAQVFPLRDPDGAAPPADGFAGAALRNANARGDNPQNLPSAVQTFASPQYTGYTLLPPARPRQAHNAPAAQSTPSDFMTAFFAQALASASPKPQPGTYAATWPGTSPAPLNPTGWLFLYGAPLIAQFGEWSLRELSSGGFGGCGIFEPCTKPYTVQLDTVPSSGVWRQSNSYIIGPTVTPVLSACPAGSTDPFSVFLPSYPEPPPCDGSNLAWVPENVPIAFLVQRTWKPPAAVANP